MHVLFLFLTILTLLILSLMLYIAFPKPGVDTSTFSLNYTSFAIASSISAIAGFFICLVFEVLMRKVRSRENELNYAYYSLKEKKKFKKRYHQVGYPPTHDKTGRFIDNHQATGGAQLEDSKGDSENTTFVLKQSVCDADFRSTLNTSSHVKNSDALRSSSKMPAYVHNLADATKSVNDAHEQMGLELDKKLSLAIINSATTGVDQVVQEKVITDEWGTDAETGEQARSKKLELIMVQGNTAPGITSRTSLENHPSLRASESKYGVSLSDKMSNFFGKLFGGSSAVKENLERKDQAIEKPKFDKNDFVVVEKKESRESLVEMTIPDLDAQAWTTDFAGNLVKAKSEKLKKLESSKGSDDKKENNIRAKSGTANYRMLNKLSGRYVHDMYTDDVKVEIRPENIASFNEELDKLWEEDDITGSVNKSDKAGSAGGKRDDFVAIDMPHDKRKIKGTYEVPLNVKLATDGPKTISEDSEGGFGRQHVKGLTIIMFRFYSYIIMKTFCFSVL